MPSSGGHYVPSTPESATITGAAKMKVTQWWATVLKIRDTPIPKNDPELVAWRKKLLERAFTLKKMIAGIVGSNTAAQMGLGVVPLVIGGVAITAILGYISVYMMDAKKYFDRAGTVENIAEKLIAKGVPADRAYTDAGKAADNAGLTSEKKFLGMPIKYIAMGLIGLGVVGFFFSRKTPPPSQAPTIVIPK